MKYVYGWWLPGKDHEFSNYLSRVNVEIDGRRVYQPQHQIACLRLASERKKRVAIDVGAHVGLWSYILAQEFEKVFSFEPSAEMRECFKRNVIRDNVTLLDVGLSDSDKKGALIVQDSNSGATYVKFDDDGNVQLRKLDDLGISDVDFIKIDVEGAEYFVIKGAEQTIRQYKPVIIIEQKGFGERFQVSPEENRNLLENLGYRLETTVVKDEIYVPNQ